MLRVAHVEFEDDLSQAPSNFFERLPVQLPQLRRESQGVVGVRFGGSDVSRFQVGARAAVAWDQVSLHLASRMGSTKGNLRGTNHSKLELSSLLPDQSICARSPREGTQGFELEVRARALELGPLASVVWGQMGGFPSCMSFCSRSRSCVHLMAGNRSF